MEMTKHEEAKIWSDKSHGCEYEFSEEALEYIEKAIKIYPYDKKFWASKWCICNELGKTEKAKECDTELQFLYNHDTIEQCADGSKFIKKSLACIEQGVDNCSDLCLIEGEEGIANNNFTILWNIKEKLESTLHELSRVRLNIQQ